MAPKEMPFHEEIFGSVGDSLFGGKEERSVVVLKDSAVDVGRYFGRELKAVDDFKEQ